MAIIFSAGLQVLKASKERYVKTTLRELDIHWPPSVQVYENLEYKLTIEFSSNYPLSAPTVKFDTPCFHPNVDQYGNICLDILKEKWSPVQNVSTILLSIQALLGDPNNDSPLNVNAAELWEDQVEYKRVLLKKYEEAKNHSKW